MELDGEKLVREGWTRRNTASGARLGEIVAAYEELGMEVLLIPAAGEADEGCRACLGGDSDEVFAVYTRSRAGFDR